MIMNTRLLRFAPLARIAVLALLPVTYVAAQEGTGAARPTFQDAAASVARQLEESLNELSELRQAMAAEQLPLTRKLNELERELIELRATGQQTTRLLDSRTLDLSNLKAEIRTREEEATYLTNLLGEYLRNFESRLHIAEIQRYEERLQVAKLAPDDPDLSAAEVYQTQADMLAVSLERLHDALGGTRFEGTAVDAGGVVQKGTFVLVGPAGLFATADGRSVGTAEQRLGSLEPAILPFEDPTAASAAAAVVASGDGLFPLDPTQGNAHKIEATQETWWEHVNKGGPVMVPIFAIAGAALLVALYKWLSLTFVRTPSRKQLAALLQAVAQGDKEAAVRTAQAMKGPAGKMLQAGVEHIEEPRELIEEVMYETVLTTRLRLNRLLPFIAITSSSAPLLGLLGTVTGIMNTFTLMTVFGTGDVKTLSSGISEALITTEYGLYVAIPSLLLYAFLSRKARAIVDGMEKAAVAFLNQVGKTPPGRPAGGAGGPDAVRGRTAQPLGVAQPVVST